jgi:hypothetical protein
VSEDPTHQPLFIPVADNRCGFTLRLFRERDGSRCAVAFTTPERLTAVLGTGQRWAELAEPALRDLVHPLGVRQLIVDPNLIAPPVTPHSHSHSHPHPHPVPPVPPVTQPVTPVTRRPRPATHPRPQLPAPYPQPAATSPGTGVRPAAALVGATDAEAVRPRP